MPEMLTRAERVTMMDQILSKLAGRQDGDPWDIVRVNMVFEEFGLDAVYIDITGDYLETARRALHGAKNSQLSEVFEYMSPSVSAGDLEQATDGIDEGAGMWQDGHVRVFLSHSAHHKNFVGEVAEKMCVYMLDGFVAHNSIEPTKQWQDEIERGLRSAQVFVGLVHPEFNDSAWTNQEVGWAKGREIPIYMIRFGADPRGFPGKVQWPTINRDAIQVAAHIATWVNSLPQYSNNIGGHLLGALRASNNYKEAGDAAQALNAFDALTGEQFAELDAIYLKNTQIHGGLLAHRGLEPLYERHKRQLPPSPLRRHAQAPSDQEPRPYNGTWSDITIGLETPAQFKRALRDATRVSGFEKLSDLCVKSGLSRGTLSPAFSENKPMPSDAVIAAIGHAIHGDVGAWLARSRRVKNILPSSGGDQAQP